MRTLNFDAGMPLSQMSDDELRAAVEYLVGQGFVTEAEFRQAALMGQPLGETNAVTERLFVEYRERLLNQ